VDKQPLIHNEKGITQFNLKKMNKIFTSLLLLISVGAFSQDGSSSKPAAVTKRVLIEEATGTWCGWCVRGIVNMDDIHKTYPTTTALVAVHNGDDMVNSTYDTGIKPKVSKGYPNGLIDRQNLQVDPGDFKTEYLKRVKYVPVIDVFIDKVTFNTTTKELSFQVNAKTVAAFNGSYRFNAVITEMQVHGTSTKYDQHNYYAGGGSGTMGGFESKPDPVKAANMYYDFVGRAILGAWDGTAGSIPATNASGATISYTYNTTLNAAWNLKNLSIVGFVINSTTGLVENASETVNINSVITGIDFTALEQNVNVYPNPTTGIITIENPSMADVTVYNIAGSEVAKAEKNAKQIDLSAFPEGVYFVRFSSQNETTVKKVALIR
jgi:hypothetical protein